MPILKDDAQVLHVYEQGNTSLVVVFYGRQLGQFRVHAKGARRWSKKGFEWGFDLLARGQVLVYPRAGESLWILKEWTEAARPEMGRTLALLRSASYLCEFTEALSRPTAGSVIEERSASSLEANKPGAFYPLLAAAADALDADGANGAVLLGFTLAALAEEGMLPQLDRCGNCSRVLLRHPKRAWLTGQGLYCETCALPSENTDGQKPQSPPAERGLWLSIEAQRALKYMAHTARALRLSQPAAEQLARALILLVHGALEQDLRTLQAAARMVYALGKRTKGGA